MSTLVVDRMTATSPPDLQVRTRGLLAGVADRRLADALRLSPLPDGDWYVRRLDVAVRLDPTRPDPSIEAAWAGTVIEALNGALRSRSSHVVHYRHRLDGLVDLVSSLALGNVERAWAWRQAGLVVDADPARSTDPAAVIDRALRSSPELVIGVLLGSLRRVGLARLHRLLGASGWVAVAELAVRAVGGRVAAEPAAYIEGAFTIDAASPSGSRTGAAEDPVVTDRVSAALASSLLAAAFRSSVIRPDEPLIATWAVLALAEADPVVLTRADAAAVIARAAELVRGGPGPDRAGSPARAGDVVAATIQQEQEQAEAEADAEPSSWPSVWCGLFFLLATATEAGLPDVLTEDRLLAERPLSWCLYGLATRLVPAAADDPAVLVFAGLPVDGEAPTVRGRPSSAEEDARLDQVARVWAEETAARLGRGSEPDVFEVVREVALRRGELAWVPAWVDVHLRLDDVDIEVRRAGLDLDPGWVPWLGMVVRFVHG